MRYYTIKIVTATDDSEVRDLRGFEVLEEALVRYHSDLQSNIGKCKSVYCAVINGAGGVYKSDTWNTAGVQPKA